MNPEDTQGEKQPLSKKLVATLAGTVACLGFSLGTGIALMRFQHEDQISQQREVITNNPASMLSGLTLGLAIGGGMSVYSQLKREDEPIPEPEIDILSIEA